MSSSCVLLGARLHLIPTLEPEMGTISHLIPRGPDRGTRSLPQVSLFNIWVLYSEAARRSEIYDQCSIRSMSHTHTKKTHKLKHTPGPAIYGVSLGLLQWGEETETETWTDGDSGRLLGDWGGEGEQKDGMRTIRPRMEERGNASSVQVRLSTARGEIRQELPRQIEIAGHTRFPSFFPFLSMIGNTHVETEGYQLCNHKHMWLSIGI